VEPFVEGNDRPRVGRKPPNAAAFVDGHREDAAPIRSQHKFRLKHGSIVATNIRSSKAAST
jgi:hypothetical protein